MKNNKTLTLEKLESSEHGIVRSGTFNYSYDEPDNPEEYNFVSVRGEVHDWTIYHGPSCMTFEYIAKRGNKIKDVNLIKTLVPCTDEALELYRF